jgi:hypothetical protein
MMILFASIYLITFYLAVCNDDNLKTTGLYCLLSGIGGMFFNITACFYYRRFHYSLYDENHQNTQAILPIANTEIVHNNNTKILCSIVYTEEFIQSYDTNIQNKELPVALQVV